MEKHGNAGPTTGTFAFADVVIDAGAHQLLRGGEEFAVEPKAFAVLLEFLSHPGQLLSRDHLLDAVWGHSFVTPATLKKLLMALNECTEWGRVTILSTLADYPPQDVKESDRFDLPEHLEAAARAEAERIGLLNKQDA